ncbi:MAG: Histidine triad (HIT) protein [candidate division TM6 bacterium GW2011_GWE2_42_60]|nr:MAG: Histidine triad (HIT) protein [candidate division TM6 bacterium GW2011_GWE2_42_60]
MSILYIPWRKNYKRKLPTEACPFCVAFLAHNDRENLVIKRFKTCALVLCLHPYNAGHLLIIPYKHTGIFADLSPEERHEIIDIMNQAIMVLYTALGCQGINTGINLGDGCAGGSIPEHLHVHVVPRFKGDTNFLPIVASSRLITRDLMDLYDTLFKAFQS